MIKVFFICGGVFKGRCESLDFIGFLGWKRRIFRLWKIRSVDKMHGMARDMKSVFSDSIFDKLIEMMMK